MTISYWLMKTEPGCYSIDDLQKDKVTYWDGVRNYQARNFMRDQMQVGDMVLFYHSNAEPSGISGIARVTKTGYPDPSQLDPQDKHFEPRATSKNPIWVVVDVQFVKKFKKLLELSFLRECPGLEKMALLQKGSRLSVQPVTEKEFKIIEQMAG